MERRHDSHYVTNIFVISIVCTSGLKHVSLLQLHHVIPYGSHTICLLILDSQNQLTHPMLLYAEDGEKK